MDPQNAEAQRTRLAPGDLLVSITADIGIVGYVDETVPIPSYINQHIARVRLDPRLANSRFVAYYLASWGPQRAFVGATDTGAKAGMNLPTVAGLTTVVPRLTEQKLIAEALSDIDQLVAALERLIAKKQAIKQGMMQQLLGGSAASRWPVEEIRSFASIGTGSKDTKDRVSNGRYPFFVRSQHVENINSWSFDGEAVLTAGDGVGTGKVFHYINGRFDYHQRVYRISNFRVDVSGRYFFHQFSRNFMARIESLTAKSSVDSVRMETIAGMQIPLPERSEQDRIAAMIDDAEAEIVVLQTRLEKAKSIKMGMMQQLLTGRMRLSVEIAS
ncbi:hypothetical protein BKG61_18000 [Mycobacterium syngnathidarum]|uniref:Type I restriction modification DNA specificity domain-containing protein n=1 Tax=Mycobacterium syngnathidarum TaxID=1908205 RepID=A0A1S1K4N3_9MYCO|nr:hypothetical protein BKG61_18000 [Mycobacterium syngnathidarum]